METILVSLPTWICIICITLQSTQNKQIINLFFWGGGFISNVPDLHEVVENANKNAQKRLLIID